MQLGGRKRMGECRNRRFSNALGAFVLVVVTCALLSPVASASMSTTVPTFNAVHVGQTTSAGTVTFTESASNAYFLASPPVTVSSAAYSLGASTCSSTLIGPGSCTQSVTFTPAVAGTTTATVSLINNFTSLPITGATGTLTGYGIAGASASPAAPAFGTSIVNRTATTVVTITNDDSTYAQTLAASPWAVSGTDAADFSVQSSTCGTSIPAGGSCAVTLAFSPTTAGSKSANVTLTTSDTAVITTMAVTATATDVSVTNPAFTTPAVGLSSSSLVTITNATGGALPLGTPSITGPQASSFGVGLVNTCTGQTIGIGGTCSMLVNFAPQAAGSASATMAVPSSALSTPITVPLNASGTVQGVITPPPSDKVTLCHSTGANTWSVLLIAPSVLFSDTHDKHAKDLIPPFMYMENGTQKSYLGLNWDASAELTLANGCVYVAAVTTPPVPPTETQVTICHWIGNTFDPPTKVGVSVAYSTHTTDAKDIIPPFTFTNAGGQKVSFAGQNWDALGQAILGTDCVEGEASVPAVPAPEVTICHSTGANKWSLLTDTTDAILANHDKKDAADIIPPFGYGSGKLYDGQNWTPQGQANYNAGCVAVNPPPAPITVSAQCREDLGNGTSYAYFSYTNPNFNAVTIAVGTLNSTNAQGYYSQKGVAPPTTFMPGTVTSALKILIDNRGYASWSIWFNRKNSTATVSKSTPTCAPPVDPNIPLGLTAACIVKSGSTYTAIFGYQSDAQSDVTIPKGVDNTVSVSSEPTGAADRGQPTVFSPGLLANAFSIPNIALKGVVTWKVTTGGTVHSATLTSTSPACGPVLPSSSPVPPPKPPVVVKPLGLFVTCVRPNTNGTYDAIFGYANPNLADAVVDLGSANAVSLAPGGPGKSDRGQPSVFQPGTNNNAFIVTFIPVGQSLTWTVSYQGENTATASSSLTECPGANPNFPPVPPVKVAPTSIGVFAECVTSNGSTYSATFGYMSSGETQATIAVGAGNRFNGTADRGQPVDFQPGRHERVFTVKGIPVGTWPSWTVTGPDGVTAVATPSQITPDCVTGAPPTTPETTPELPPTGPVKEGFPKPITITASNPGDLPIYDVIDVLPKTHGLAYLKASSRRGDCSITQGRVVFRRDALLPGQSVPCRITVRVLSCSAVVQASAKGRKANSAFTQFTGGARRFSSCRPRGASNVTG